MGKTLAELLDLLPPGASLYHGLRGWVVRYPRYKWSGKNRSDVSYSGSYRRSSQAALQDFVKWHRR